MNPTWDREIKTELLNDVEKLIYHSVHQFKKRYGGDFDDLLGVAHLSFLRVCETHDESKGASFSTWLRRVLWNDMLEHQRRECKRREKCSSDDTELEVVDPRSVSTRFDLAGFLELLSVDAQTIINLILDPPKTVLHDSCKGKGRTEPPAPQLRKAVKEYLAGTGWSAKRVSSGFSEIRKVMYESLC